MFDGCDCRVWDTGTLETSNGLLSRLVCGPGRLLNVQRCCGFVLVIKSVEIGGDGCFNDCGQASFEGLLRQETSCDSILDDCLDARFGCYDCSQVRRSRDVSRSLVANSKLACAECGLYHAIFRETWDEPFERPLSNLIVDFRSPLFLKDCVTVNSQDAVDAADSQNFLGGGQIPSAGPGRAGGVRALLE